MREQIEKRKQEGLSFHPQQPRFISMGRGNAEANESVQSKSQFEFNPPSPLKKNPPSLLEKEADKMWGSILNEDYRKFMLETEQEKIKKQKKKQESCDYLHKQIVVQQKEKEIGLFQKNADADRQTKLNRQKKLFEEIQRKMHSNEINKTSSDNQKAARERY